MAKDGCQKEWCTAVSVWRVSPLDRESCRPKGPTQPAHGRIEQQQRGRCGHDGPPTLDQRHIATMDRLPLTSHADRKAPVVTLHPRKASPRRHSFPVASRPPKAGSHIACKTPVNRMLNVEVCTRNRPGHQDLPLSAAEARRRSHVHFVLPGRERSGNHRRRRFSAPASRSISTTLSWP